MTSNFQKTQQTNVKVTSSQLSILRRAQFKFSKERFQYKGIHGQEPQQQNEIDTINNEQKLFSKAEYFQKAKEENNTIDLVQLLLDRGVELNNPRQNITSLPLTAYDDVCLEQVFVEDNIDFEGTMFDVGESHYTITGKILYMKYNQEGQQEMVFQEAEILSYDNKKLRFRVIFKQTGERRLVPRIYICFDHEDHDRWCSRFQQAWKTRTISNSLIRRQYYLEAMPTDHLSQLSYEQKNKIEGLVRSNKKLEFSETSGLLMEVSKEYSITMNSILFEKNIEKQTSEIVPHNLVLPPEKPQQEVQYKGMLELEKQKGAKEVYLWSPHEVFKVEPKSFTELFKDLLLNSVFVTQEGIKCIQDIKGKCNSILNVDFFSNLIPNIPYKIDEFKSVNDQVQLQNIQKIKVGLINDIVLTIQNAFQGEEKSWYNFKETNRLAYEAGKMFKFITTVRLIIQDSILSLCQRTFDKYDKFIRSFIPQSVIITGINNVNIQFSNGYKVSSTDPQSFFSPLAVQPLFVIDLIRSSNEEEFSYSTPSKNFAQTIMVIFDKALDDLQKTPDIEQKLMVEMYRTIRNEQFLKVPQKSHLEAPQDPRLFDENRWINVIYDKLKQDIELSLDPLDTFLRCFDVFKEILKIKPDDYIRKIENEEKPREVEAIRDEINIFIEKEIQLRKQIPDSVQVSYFRVNCRDIVQLLAGKYLMLSKGLIEILGKRIKQNSQKLYEEIQVIKVKLNQPPKDIEKLTEIKEYMQQIPVQIEKMKIDIDRSMAQYEIIEPFKFKFTPEDIIKKWQVFSGPKEIFELVDARTAVFEKDKIVFMEAMKSQQDDFKEQAEQMERTITNFYQYQNINQHEEVSKIVKSLNDQLNFFQEEARKFNSRELLFDLEQTDYSKIQQMVKDFQPYSILWMTTTNWFKNSVHWLNDEWETIDADQCEKFVEEAFKNMSQTARYFKEKDIPPIQKIGDIVRQQLDEFRPKVPLLVALRKKGMKDRHWEQVSQKVGFEVKPYEGFNFTKVLEMGLLKFSEQCVEIGERAAKEYQIENMLSSMMKAWEDINFDVGPYKNISFIIRGYDEIGAVLDEHIINTQTMQFSPFKKPFEEELMNWNNTLKRMSDILEEWAKCQMNWMYLQPIFDSADISKQLPAESKKFKQVDSNWKQIMLMTKQVVNVLKVCQSEGLLEKLQDGNKNLDLIQKELDNYLGRKRERFARFYFLSNDELLEILSQTKEPTAVQPHLKKVFENINQIEFDSAKKIHAMFSAENEKIPFVKIVDPNNKNVEDWMTDVEDQMKKSVRAAIYNSVQDYLKQKRIKWVTLHPGQCVLNGSQVHWTKEVEDAIKNQSVDKYFEFLQIQLNDLVDLVRTKLTKQQRVTLGALIVIDVHAKDVIETIKKAAVDDITAFEWISQLRYYWEYDDIYVKCIQTNFPYGYEYLGNTLRLVITPLTDKCYMTLMGALKLNLGGAPAGPAGTGKTESTKDLAKALAKQCVVFNCSDSMDCLMIAKFFKGLAAAGAWACFDEFNRINIEVLSVIAQQLLVLFGEKARGSPRVEFEGTDIRLDPTFSVFITMNPGYAGRTELPDNLKALFRGVAMMVPDYALIGEIMLYSFGFKQGRALAKKMVVTFKLSSEQLSSQDHYDYGMRAVRSVINTAGMLKSAEPDMEENQLLLRALRDVNVPKFLKDDLPLFENIIKDLFPGVKQPQPDIGSLLTSINQQSELLNLQTTESFIFKINQLYDTILVRHGLMLVGPTGGAKTSTYQVLGRALTALQNSEFYKVLIHIMNPKSIQLGQLYGQFNEQTREWNDGILAYTVREACKDQSSDRHWIMFDGPVDAIWIENMNTVLDDNKKLCLNSGQILTLTPYMTMMFEVEDLAVASPATVSRCGMVYMEPVSLGLEPLIISWLNTIPEGCKKLKSFSANLKILFDKFLEPCLDFLDKNIKEVVQTMNNNLTISLTKLLNCFLQNYKDTEVKKVTKEELDQLDSQLEQVFIFCLIWSITCTGDYEGRKKFDIFLRDHIKSIGSTVQIPQNGSIYDFHYSEKTKLFTPWSDQFKGFEVDQKLSYSEIMIPTSDSQRNIYLMKLLLSNNYHCLLPGPTGTGKSLNAVTLLNTQMGEDFQYISLSFSAQTSANQTQDTIDSKIEKRRKGFFGPPVGKRCIIFVDDLNMPKKEEYGAQPPIELLRQYMDHKGWYNRKDLQFMNLQDLIVLSAMGPPGGGRQPITARLMRHYNIIAYTELDYLTIKQIFCTLVASFLKRFNESIRDMVVQLVDSVLLVYERVKNELLPTPKKSHYTFNLRDINKVFQGICSASTKFCQEPLNIVKLWFHENMRVFHDRLINSEDRQQLIGILKDQFPKFQLTEQQVMSEDRIIFSDFQQGRDVEPRHYYQVQDLKQLGVMMNQFQEEYNQDPSFSGLGGKKSMKLVLFLDACEHIARICRVLRQPSGNALLLGVGGSGRQSLAKMATFISYYRLFQIEVIKTYNMRSWREDVKKVLMIAGVENKGVTFLFVDTQIIYEQMLEDMNSILNSGDVTNIYQDKDMEEIVTACKHECTKRGLQPNKMNIFTQYLNRVKNNIHLIMAMSPLNEQFSTRIRMFPSLVNCCTIDWFTEWPEEALIGVGTGQLHEFAQEYNFSDDLPKIVDMCKIIHKSVESISVKYQQELRRFNYVTPTSFLELLTMFKQVNKEKRLDLKWQINRLKSGLDKLIGANLAVADMQIQLTKMKPELEAAAIETQNVMVKLEVDKKEADVTQKIVAVEEAEATKQTLQAQELQRTAEQSVEQAQQSLNVTLLEVQKLRKEHLVEIKSLPNPPRACVIVLGGMSILLLDKIRQIGGSMIMMNVEGQPGKKEEDYFTTAKRFLINDPKELLDFLMNYDRDHINQKLITQLENKVLKDPDFTLDRAKTCSFAVRYLFSWCMAMYDYNKVFLETQPMRDKLMAAQKMVEQMQATLKIKKDALEEVNQKIQALTDLFNEKVTLKENLQQKMEECQIKLERAFKLTSGLSDEKERWTLDVAKLSKREPLIPGDSIISAAMLAYSGPFVSSYRQRLESLWLQKLVDLGILHTLGQRMTQFMGEPVKIQSWNIAGLPKDDTSIENGIIIDKSRRYPLMIDPQTQANKFIKNLGKEHEEGIEILKINDNNLMRTLELAIQFGKWVMIENVAKDLDPSFDPILLQQVVKSGSNLSITLGDKTLSFNERFKFFMTTTIPNPHYPPETFVKVSIINFAITPSGLEDQMLAQIVALENPQLEQKKIEIVKRNAADKKDLLDIEDQILKSLSERAGDINEVLKDETLINQLQNSKKFAVEINQRVQDSKITEEQIDKAREGYRPVAFRASSLFFCIVDLSGIDPMYQYSLQWFMNLFAMGVENSQPAKELDQRLNNLNNYFTYSLYENVCRSLFEKHKLLFSLMLTVKILQGQDLLDNQEWRYLLAGPSGEIKTPQNPTNWIAENTWPSLWSEIYGMTVLPKFVGFDKYFLENVDLFKQIYDSNNPQDQILPGHWQQSFDDFERLIFIKAFRPDKVIPCIQNWISDRIGRQFIIPPVFDLAKCYKDSTVQTPLIFVLSAGSDPVADFLKFAGEKEMLKRYDQISLGQGQGPKAEKMIRDARLKGGWVLLQNCHLAISWMQEFERICEEIDENVNRDYRLWCTSMPSNFFPISVLQNGVKMTLEPPSGLRSNLLRTYAMLSDDDLTDCKKPEQYKTLLFGFSFFHAIIQDRRKFGAIGWNIPYEFTNEDLTVCKRQLKMMLDEYEQVPYKVLNYLGAEINYGGRVTDDKDVRLITTILRTYIRPESLNEGYAFSISGTYKQPVIGQQQDYINYIESLPLNPAPEVFGLHENADITNAQNQTRSLLETILSVQPRTGVAGGKTREQIIEDLANFVQSRTPAIFNIQELFKKYPTDYNESMNTVLIQEIVRYNKLLQIMKISLMDVKKALVGLVVMSEDLEKLSSSLFDNQVPKMWAEKGFLSLKPLASWTQDLNDRIKFLQSWIDGGTPNIFWISGFFFPQAFITSIFQNYARKRTIPVDKLSFEYRFRDDITFADVKEKPKEGCIIYGMYLEGCRWSNENHALDQSRPKELYSDMPLVQLIPQMDREVPESGVYHCPMYKVVSRSGTLSTTGHSTNFVMYLEIPSKEVQDIWIKAGVAAFLALRY